MIACADEDSTVERTVGDLCIMEAWKLYIKILNYMKTRNAAPPTLARNFKT